MRMGRTVGLMTGAVLHGNIDVALLRPDGERIKAFGLAVLVPYAPGITSCLSDCLGAARDWGFDGPEPALFAEVARDITIAQSGAVAALLAEAGIAPEDVAAVGFHGQTVLHRAPTGGSPGATRQLGDWPAPIRWSGFTLSA